MRYFIRSSTVVGLALLVMAHAAPAEARRVALVIGNSAYEHTRVLPNAASDAHLIAELLRKIGFTVTEASDIAYRPMREAIRTFGETAQGAEMALVYYAGHGMEVSGENWLLPVSAALRHERDLEYEAVGLSSILAAVKGAGRLKLIILDACRNNPLGERIELASGATRSVTRGLARVEPSGDILVAYSAKHGTLAEDGPAGGNSPFAAALAASLGTPGLDVRIMLGKVRDDVRRATGGRQEPFTYGSVGGETIALLPGDAPSIAPVPRPVVVLPPQPVKPVVPSIEAPSEPLPADIPISAEVLHLIETHPFFANAPPVLARFHDAAWTESRDNWVTVYRRKTTVHRLRPGLIKADKISQETTIQSGKRYPQTRRESEISAANGFLVLGSKSSVVGSGASGADSETLLRINNMKGSIFPIKVGNRFSYEAKYHQKIMGERTNKLSCEVTQKFEAKTLHANLFGLAYEQICTTQVRYPRKGINHNSSFTSYFLEALGTWIDTGEKFTLKSFETAP